MTGQVILVTGGGSGLGRGLVDYFVGKGAHVGVLEVSDDKVRSLQVDYGGDSPVTVVCGDARNYKDNQNAVEATVNAGGHLDAFIQCAGVTDWTPAFTRLPIDRLPEAFDNVMQVNVLGPTLGALAAIDELRKSRGSIVFTLSTSGYFPGGQGALYTLSKNALRGLVTQLAYELAPEVRVNGVVPGPVKESRMGGPSALGQEDLYPERAFPDMEGLVRRITPLKVYARASEYGPIYELLVNREAAKLATGAIMFWDSGISVVGHGTAVKDALDAGEI